MKKKKEEDEEMEFNKIIVKKNPARVNMYRAYCTTYYY